MISRMGVVAIAFCFPMLSMSLAAGTAAAEEPPRKTAHRYLPPVQGKAAKAARVRAARSKAAPRAVNADSFCLGGVLNAGQPLDYTGPGYEGFGPRRVVGGSVCGDLAWPVAKQINFRSAIYVAWSRPRR